MKDIVERMQSWRVGKLAGRDELIVDDLQSGAAEICRLRIELQGEQVAFDLLEKEVERLREANVRLQEALAADPMDQSAEIERLRVSVSWRDKQLVKQGIEIERLRAKADANARGFSDARAEIERLRSVVKVLRRAGGNDNACCS